MGAAPGVAGGAIGAVRVGATGRFAAVELPGRFDDEMIRGPVGATTPPSAVVGASGPDGAAAAGANGARGALAGTTPGAETGGVVRVCATGATADGATAGGTADGATAGRAVAAGSAAMADGGVDATGACAAAGGFGPGATASGAGPTGEVVPESEEDAGPATGRGADGVSTTSATTAGADSVAVSAAFFLPPFAGTGSSGCTSRINPSRSARRRARSACASSIPDEWLLTPMPRTAARSSISLLVSPSSRASSCTRIFAAKWCSVLINVRGADGCNPDAEHVKLQRPRAKCRPSPRTLGRSEEIRGNSESKSRPVRRLEAGTAVTGLVLTC